MAPDFSTPHRQSPIGVVVMFADTVRQSIRAILPILIIWIFRIDEINKFYLFGGVFFTFLVISAAAYLRYRNFTFMLDEENQEFLVSEGIFNKTRTVIQLNKIQQVNITQSLIQRLIGVYALDVDTAGSNSKEGKIKAVSHDLAVALKERLLDNEAIKTAVVEPDAETSAKTEEPFINISFLSLLKVGITSNYLRTIGLLLAFFLTIFDNLRHLAQNTDIENGVWNYINASAAAGTIGLLIVILLTAVLIINVIRTIVKYFNFSITKQKGSLLLTFGLLNIRNTIIKPEKVQITKVTRNYFQKKMDILEIHVRQATSGEKEEKKSAIEIPGCSENERDAIFRLFFRSMPEKGAMLKPNFRMLVFSIFLTIVLPLGSYFFIAYNLAAALLEFVWIIPVYTAFMLLVLCFGFRNYRLFISDDFIIKQSGAWDISNEIIVPGKIQAITTSQLFWHKSLNIGSVTIHTAGGNVVFNLGNYDKLKGYINLWLYEMERSDSNWM
ncbi:MAG TPA: PH domain-containing protein [Flavobacterium sp.]|jgi:putative membrane protein